MSSIRTLLIIEDNPGDVRLLREMLDENDSHRAELIHAGTMHEAMQHLAKNAVDIILLDLGLPDAQGLAAIKSIRAAAPQVPLVVLTGMDDELLAMRSLQEGAQDYLIKGQVETRGLLRALRYAGERKRLEKLKDEFVSTVSHELRTPLTSIAGSLGLLMGGAGGILLSPHATRLMRIAHSNCDRLVRLINDILDLEKLESGSLVFDLRQIEVRSLVEQVIKANQKFAASQGVQVRIGGASSTAAHVRADSDRVSQVITNLLANAIKFSARDKEVVVTIETDSDLVRISVQDHGSGIPTEFRSHVFERFARADATDARLTGGTGLGLTIVKQIVDRLGGEVSFVDASGGGTIFSVELPSWEGKADLLHEERMQANARLDSETSLENLLEEGRELLPLAPPAGNEVVCRR
jgi:signal transduction histidine kinase